MNPEGERPVEARLEARLSELHEATKTVVNELQRDGSPEAAIAGVLSMHEMLNFIVRQSLLQDPQQNAAFIRSLHDGIRGIQDALLMGDVGERFDNQTQIAANPHMLRSAFRDSLREKLGKIGPTETTMSSESTI